jgi:hypothetical protein
MAWSVATTERDVAKASPESFLALKMADNVKIVKGSFVQIDPSTGYAVPCAADNASYLFAGVARETVDNTVLGHTAGGKYITVDIEGIFSFICVSGAQTWVGTKAYMTIADVTKGDQTVISADPGAKAMLVGRITEVNAASGATECRVRIDGYAFDVLADAS